MTHDRRMVPAALIAWAVAALLVTTGSVTAAITSAVAVGVAAVGWRQRGARALLLAAVCVAAVAASCAWRLASVEQSPVTELAQHGRQATLEVQVSRDARQLRFQGRDSTVVEALVRRVVTADQDVRVRSRVTAFIDGMAEDLVVGRILTIRGRLGPSTSSDVAAVIQVVKRGQAHGAPWWWESSEHVRNGVRRAVAHLADEPRALVPALVDGDETRITEEIEQDFRRSGLTHLMAVSGTNLTIVLAVMMALARASGVRRSGLWIVGTFSIIAFVLLARPEPSVVRAAAMGAVGIAALGFGARGGLRALCWAVLGLLFLDPWLSRSAGFILSVCATTGILVLAPLFARRLEMWMPGWCALALAVPLAAQLACTPAVAALSGEVSLVAVFANLLAAPAVAPATIAGLMGGIAALAWEPAGQLCGMLAGASASWILTVGHTAAGLDSASLQWQAPWQVLLVVIPLLTLAALRIATHPAIVTGLLVGLVIGIWRPPQTGWPPPGWIMVSCDVGQGDASVLPVAHGEAVVVDTGQDAVAVDRCLTSLRISTVRLLILTHGDADHVDGWRGVVSGRRVDQIVVGSSGGPPIPDIPQHSAVAGESFMLGETSAEVLWPPAANPSMDSGATDNRNDVSVVLRATVRGIVILLTGDIGAEAQRRVLRENADITADVLKVPHHGSADQDRRFLAAVGASVATISSGADNDYGHPTASLLETLRKQGVRSWRTDTDGDIAVVVRDGHLRVVSRN